MNDILIVLISSVAGIVGAVITTRAQRPSRLKDITESSADLDERMRTEIKRLDDDLAECRKVERDLRRRVFKLEQALRAAGIDPLTINGT